MKIVIQSYSATGIRSNNEDMIDINNNLDNKEENKLNILYTAVYDGHGGPDISKSLVNKINICKYFCNKDDNLLSKFSNDKFFLNLFTRIQNKLINYYPSANTMGSTALISLIYKNKNKYQLKIINLGDSRAIICNKYFIGNALSLDHKPHLINEKNRILKMGGIIEYDNSDDPRIYGMSVSRSFGDLDNKYISQKPDIYNYILSNDKFLVLACDGIWDVLGNQEVVDFILENYYELINSNKNLLDMKGKSLNNIAYKLAEYAINNKKSKDNISIIIVFFTDYL